MAESTLIAKLKRISNEQKALGLTDDVVINVLKQELQYYILDFVYNSTKYAKFVMYGGTLLRIGYGLSRMSEDLDFQTHEEIDIDQLKLDVTRYFEEKYTTKVDITSRDAGESGTVELKIGFDILSNFGLKSIPWTKLRIRFDINTFEQIGTFVTENLPIAHEGLVFTIRTYPLSTLMASKVVAVLNRTSRVIAGEQAACKPRDIYDLLWYLERKSIPDIEYLQAKGVKYQNVLELFDAIKLRVANLDDNLFEKDLAQFFFDRTDYENWFANWRQRFLNLIGSYSMNVVKEISSIILKIDFTNDIRYIHYVFNTDKQTQVTFIVPITDLWFRYEDLIVNKNYRQHDIEKLVSSSTDLTESEYAFIGLFYNKILDFVRRNGGITYTDRVVTKMIRASADDLIVKDQIYLDRRLLEKVQFEELV